MPETGPKEIDNSEIVQEQKKDNELKDITIEEALQESLPNDESKQKLFLEIFNQPIFKNLPQQNTNNELSQTNIIEYIKSGRLFGNSRTISKMESLEEKIKFTIEDMDKYFKSTTGSVKEIKTYTNTLNETLSDKDETLSDKDETLSDKDETLSDKDETLSDKDETLSDKDKQIEIKNTLLEARKATKESYDALDDKYKVSDEQVTQLKSDERNKQFITQLTQNIQDIDLSVDEYLKFYITATNNKKELQGTEFMKNYEALNNILNTTSMEALHTPKNVDTLIQKNENIKNYSNNSSSLNKLSTPNLPETKNFDEEFDMYIKFIDDEKEREEFIEKKDDLKKYKEIYDKTPDEAIKIQEGAMNKIYIRYKSSIQKIKEELPTQTKEFAKKRVLGSCITGLAKYFDSSTSIINKNNFDKDFAIDTQDGFSIDKGKSAENEGGDDIMHMKGNINGSEVGFYYNLTNPEATLQSDDFLSFDKVSQNFVFKEGGGGKTNLGVKLPTIDFLTDKAQNILDDNFTKIMAKAKSGEEFEAAIKERISKGLLKYYRQEVIVETRVERDIEKNITVQTLQNTFFPDAVLAEFNKEGKTINNTTETTAWNIVNIRDKTTENMRSDQLKTFRSLIQRFNNEMQQNTHPNVGEERTQLFAGIKSEQQTVNYNQRGTSIEKFFTIISDNGKINLEDFEKIVKILEKNKNIDINDFSPNFQTQRTKDTAVNDLHLENISIRGK